MNNKNSVVLLGLAGILVFVVLCGIGTNNSLVLLQESVRSRWSQVQNVYQRRADIVAQTTATVAAGSAQELAIFKALRDQAAGIKSLPAEPPTGVDGQKVIDQLNAFDKAALDVKVYVASNPQITSVGLYRDMLVVLEGSENRVAVARMDYINAVRTYRAAVRQFPTSLVGSLFGARADDFAYFQATEAAQSAPVIVFSTPSLK